MIKEEIKAFLANRRISQAVVAQVTGKSSGRGVLSSFWESQCLNCLSEHGADVGISLGFLHCSADLSA